MSVEAGVRQRWIGWGVSLLLHGLLITAILLVRPTVHRNKHSYMRVEVRRPVPAKPPPPRVETRPKPPKAKARKPPKVVDLTTQPVTRKLAVGRSAAKPVFGLHKKAISLGGAFKVRVGNTLRVVPTKKIVDPALISDEAPAPLSEIIRMPRVEEPVLPAYPEDLRLEGIEGVVLIEVVISSRGIVTRARIIKTVDPRFNRAALLAVRRTRFAPARTVDGPVAVKIRLPVEFRLSQP